MKKNTKLTILMLCGSFLGGIVGYILGSGIIHIIKCL